jgi:hypothetical protein
MKFIMLWIKQNKSAKVQAGWPSFPQQTIESQVGQVAALAIIGKETKTKKRRLRKEKYLNFLLKIIFFRLLFWVEYSLFCLKNQEKRLLKA